MGQFPQLWATAWPSQPVLPSHRHRVGVVVPPRAVVTEAFKEGKAAVGLLWFSIPEGEQRAGLAQTAYGPNSYILVWRRKPDQLPE